MLLSIGSIVFYPLIASIFIFSGIAKYSFEIQICAILIVFICAINIILLKYKRHVWKVSYLGIGLSTYLMTFILYLSSGTSWNYEMNVDGIVFIISPIAFDILLIIYRLVIKNQRYMNAIRVRKAHKYFLVDTIIIFSILSLLLFLIKTSRPTAFFSGFSMFYNITSIIFGNLMISVGIVSHVSGIYNYFRVK